MQPFKLKPTFKDYLWGGTRLRDDFHMQSELEKLAEAWVLSCHKDGACYVENGDFAGKTLAQTIEILGKDCLGNNCAGFSFFPILIKLIDAKQPLSVQVHPSDGYALENEHEYGKTEMWYVVDCDEGAYLYYGFKSVIDKDEFLKRIKENTLTDVLNKVSVHKGDCFFINSGTIHAIGKGILIAEIQQNSNSTYRVYDYGRVGADGKPRQLHIEKAADVTCLAPPEYPFGKPEGDLLAKCGYFTVTRHCVDGNKIIDVDGSSFSALLCVDGSATVDGVRLEAGDCVFIPAYYGEAEISGNAEILESRV